MFSVVVPLYNKEHSIQATLMSILHQSHKDFEIIVVNDGSTDNSTERVQSIDDPRIKMIHKSNGGVSSARNVGIMKAKGDYIALLDADDYWDPEYLSRMWKLISEFPHAALFGCQIMRAEEDSIFTVNRMHTERGYIDDYFQACLIAPLFSASSIIIKSICFEETGYFSTELQRGEDIEMWVRLARKYRIAFEPVPLVKYKLDEPNRACRYTPDIKHYYFESKLWGRPRAERVYFLKLARSTITQMIKARRFGSFLLLLYKYNIFVFVIMVIAVRKHMEKRNQPVRI